MSLPLPLRMPPLMGMVVPSAILLVLVSSPGLPCPHRVLCPRVLLFVLTVSVPDTHFISQTSCIS